MKDTCTCGNASTGVKTEFFFHPSAFILVLK